MKFLVQSVLVAVAAMFVALPAGAHDNFEAYEVRCLEVPRMLRRNATNHQWFEISNVERTPVVWYFLSANLRGALASNLARQENRDWGVLEGYTSARTSNTSIQRRDVPVSREESALLCVSGAGEDDYGYFAGQVLVRELRRWNGQWVAFDLRNWWSWWTVTETSSASTASKSAPAFDAIMIRGRRLSN